MSRRPGSGKGWVNEGGYRVIRVPADHPQARSNGEILEHRYVMWESHVNGGVDVDGPQECEWCRHLVWWGIRHRAAGTDAERWDALVVDHVDGIKTNNDLGNLAASCPWCNANRPYWRRFGVSGEDFVGIHPKDRPRFGELAKLASKGTVARPVAVSRPPQVRPQARLEPERTPVPLVAQPQVWLLRWISSNARTAQASFAGVLGFALGVFVAHVVGADRVSAVLFGVAVGIGCGVWAPGPPKRRVRSRSTGPMVAPATGWVQLSEAVKAYQTPGTLQRAAARAEAESRAEPLVSDVVAEELDEEPDEDEFDDDDDGVVVPLVFPDAGNRGPKSPGV